MVLGNEAFSVKWQQIETPHFKVISTKEFKDKAEDVALKLEQAFQLVGNSLDNSRDKKITVVIHSETSYSNGFVSYAPSRSEFFSTPTLYSTPIDWMTQLAVHESRHIEQLNKIDSEIPGVLKLIFGEQIVPILFLSYTPFWLIEGDAVATETAFTEIGRGVLPSFSRETKALVVEREIYSYDKSYIGSYRDFVPDYYKMGYFMVSHIRSKSEADIVGKILDREANKPLSLTPVEHVLKESTGSGKLDTYSECYNSLRERWIAEPNAIEETPFKTVSPTNKNYSSYLHPHLLPDSSTIALKESLNRLTSIVSIDKYGKETKLESVGTVLDNYIDVADNSVVWAESHKDPRWEYRDNSDLYIYNIDTKKIKRLNIKKQISTPSLSKGNDKNRIAAIETNGSYEFKIVIIDPETGATISSVEHPSKHAMFNPSWSIYSKSILFIGQTDVGRYIGEYNIKDNSFKRVTREYPTEIYNPIDLGKNIAFVSGLSGVENIHIVDKANREERVITSSKFGVRGFSIDNDKLLYSDYSSSGYSAVEASLSTLIANSKVIDNYDRLIADSRLESNHLREQEAELCKKLNRPTTMEKIAVDTTQFSYSKYRKTSGLFNIHSWVPAAVDLDNIGSINPGVTLMSQNNLSTMVTTLGYSYDPSTKENSISASFEYRGLYPTLSLDVDYDTYRFNTEVESGRNSTEIIDIRNRELNTALAVSLPLSFRSRDWSRTITPTISGGLLKLHQFANEGLDYDTKVTGSHITTSLSLSNIQYKKAMNIQSRWGQIVQLNYRNSLSSDIDYGNIAALQAKLYLPGVSWTHGISAYWGYQTRWDQGDNSFSDIVSTARGFSLSQYSEDLRTIKLDYKLPLLYPDLSIGGLAYLKRVTGGIFYDNTHLTPYLVDTDGEVVVFNDSDVTKQSIGANIDLDIYPLRTLLNINLGNRFIYLLDDEKFKHEFYVSFGI